MRIEPGRWWRPGRAPARRGSAPRLEGAGGTTTCEKCHGPDGHASQTGEGLSFADGEWNHGSDMKSVVEVITNGVPDTGMNAFKGKLSA